MLRKIVVLLFALCIANVYCDAKALYSLDESDGYIYCTRHHELVWYIVEDSLELDSEDDMLVIYADVVTLNDRSGDTKTLTHKYFYDEENHKMYFYYSKNGEKIELQYRDYWAGTGCHYYIGNMAYYLIYGERFFD